MRPADKALKALKMLAAAHDIDSVLHLVRQRAIDDPNYSGNTWEHPNVKLWGEACKLAKEAIKEDKADNPLSISLRPHD